MVRRHPLQRPRPLLLCLLFAVCNRLCGTPPPLPAPPAFASLVCSSHSVHPVFNGETRSLVRPMRVRSPLTGGAEQFSSRDSRLPWSRSAAIGFDVAVPDHVILGAGQPFAELPRGRRSSGFRENRRRTGMGRLIVCRRPLLHPTAVPPHSFEPDVVAVRPTACVESPTRTRPQSRSGNCRNASFWSVAAHDALITTTVGTGSCVRGRRVLFPQRQEGSGLSSRPADPESNACPIIRASTAATNAPTTAGCVVSSKGSGGRGLSSRAFRRARRPIFASIRRRGFCANNGPTSAVDGKTRVVPAETLPRHKSMPGPCGRDISAETSRLPVQQRTGGVGMRMFQDRPRKTVDSEVVPKPRPRRQPGRAQGGRPRFAGFDDRDLDCGLLCRLFAGWQDTSAHPFA